MGIEEQIDRLIDAGDDILKALETLNQRVAEIAKRFSPTVVVVENEPPAKPKRWRRLGPKEIVLEGDWMNARSNSQDKDPPYGGWIPAKRHYWGREADFFGLEYFAREVSDDAEEDEPPAKPKRWRYRKENEMVQASDWCNARANPPGTWPPENGWIEVSKASHYVGKFPSECSCVFACEVTDDANQSDQSPDAGEMVEEEPVKEPQPPEPEYREPVLPADARKQCEFSEDGKEWCRADLTGWRPASYCWRCSYGGWWRFARIRKDA